MINTGEMIEVECEPMTCDGAVITDESLSVRCDLINTQEIMKIFERNYHTVFRVLYDGEARPQIYKCVYCCWPFIHAFGCGYTLEQAISRCFMHYLLKRSKPEFQLGGGEDLFDILS